MANSPKYRDLPYKKVSGTIVPQGLKAGGLIEPWTVNDSTWTKIVDIPYTVNGEKVNAVNIQNQTGPRIKVNYEDKGAASWEGIILNANSERQYAIQPNTALVLWAKAEPTSGDASGVTEKLA